MQTRLCNMLWRTVLAAVTAVSGERNVLPASCCSTRRCTLRHTTALAMLFRRRLHDCAAVLMGEITAGGLITECS